MTYSVGDRVKVIDGIDAGKSGTVMRLIDPVDRPGMGQYLTVRLDGESWTFPEGTPWYPHFVGSALAPYDR